LAGLNQASCLKVSGLEALFENEIGPSRANTAHKADGLAGVEIER
jgi:hypothetical protein